MTLEFSEVREMQFAVWAVWILIVGGCFVGVYGDKVKGPIGSGMNDWGIRAVFLGLILSPFMMTYLANASHP